MNATNIAPRRLSIKEQAEYLDTLLTRRCEKHGVENFVPWSLYLDDNDVEVLRELVERLKRMAPHEDAIRRTVVGR